MRELTLLETGYLAGLLLLTLVLPLMISLNGPRTARPRRSCMKTVWLGQAFGAFAGLTVLASAPAAPFAAVSGLMSCIGCALVLVRQFQAARAASGRSD